MSKFQQVNFTTAHLQSSIDSAGGGANPTPDSIASAIATNTGAKSVNNPDPDPHDDVNAMWNDFFSDNTQCQGYASGLCYMLCCLGVDNANVATANLRCAIQDDGAASASTICMATRTAYKLQGVVSFYGLAWKGNFYQGCAYLQSLRGATKCYDAEHGRVNKYWELGNSSEIPPNYPAAGTSGTGVLYFYRWGTVPNSGPSDWITTNLTIPPVDSAGNPLAPTTVHYAGN